MSVPVAIAQPKTERKSSDCAVQPTSESLLKTQSFPREHRTIFSNVDVSEALEILACRFSSVSDAVLSLRTAKRTPEITGMLVQEILCGEADGLYHYATEAMKSVAPELLAPSLFVRSFHPDGAIGNDLDKLSESDRHLTTVRILQLVNSDLVSERLLSLVLANKLGQEVAAVVAGRLSNDKNELIRSLVQRVPGQENREIESLGELPVSEELSLSIEALNVSDKSGRRGKILKLADHPPDYPEFVMGVLAAASKYCSVKEVRFAEKNTNFALQVLKQYEERYFGSSSLYDRLKPQSTSARYHHVVF